MNEEILKLASEVGLRTIDEPHYIITFYKAVYNKGVSDAATKAGRMVNGKGIATAIRALEMKCDVPSVDGK